MATYKITYLNGLFTLSNINEVGTDAGINTLIIDEAISAADYSALRKKLEASIVNGGQPFDTGLRFPILDYENILRTKLDVPNNNNRVGMPEAMALKSLFLRVVFKEYIELSEGMLDKQTQRVYYNVEARGDSEPMSGEFFATRYRDTADMLAIFADMLRVNRSNMPLTRRLIEDVLRLSKAKEPYLGRNDVELKTTLVDSYSILRAIAHLWKTLYPDKKQAARVHKLPLHEFVLIGFEVVLFRLSRHQMEGAAVNHGNIESYDNARAVMGLIVGALRQDRRQGFFSCCLGEGPLFKLCARLESELQGGATSVEAASSGAGRGEETKSSNSNDNAFNGGSSGCDDVRWEQNWLELYELVGCQLLKYLQGESKKPQTGAHYNSLTTLRDKLQQYYSGGALKEGGAGDKVLDLRGAIFAIRDSVSVDRDPHLQDLYGMLKVLGLTRSQHNMGQKYFPWCSLRETRETIREIQPPMPQQVAAAETTQPESSKSESKVSSSASTLCWVAAGLSAFAGAVLMVSSQLPPSAGSIVMGAGAGEGGDCDPYSPHNSSLGGT